MPETTEPTPRTTEPPPEIPVKLAFLKEPVLMNFAMVEPGTVAQLDILKGNERLSTVNVTGNNTISAGQRMLVDIQTSNNSVLVTLTLINVTCSDEGIYVVVAKGDDMEKRKSVNMTVFSKYLIYFCVSLGLPLPFVFFFARKFYFAEGTKRSKLVSEIYWVAINLHAQNFRIILPPILEHLCIYLQFTFI